MTLLPREGPILEATDIGRDLDWVKQSSLAGTNRMLALLAVASGMPIGCGQNGEPLSPTIGYLVHPALIYGGWVNLAKRSGNTQTDTYAELFLGVPPGGCPKSIGRLPIHGTARGKVAPGGQLPQVLVTTPRELSPRHSRLLASLLLDLVARCAGVSVEMVIEEQLLAPIFKQTINQKAFHQMVGMDLPMDDCLAILDNLREVSWSLPGQIRTWDVEESIFLDRDYMVDIPGILGIPDRTNEGGAWLSRSFGIPLEQCDLWRSPFSGEIGKCRNTMDILWDARILGWCWSTAKWLHKKKGMEGPAAIATLARRLLDEKSPLLLRKTLFLHMSDTDIAQIRMGLTNPVHRSSSDRILRDVFGTTCGATVEKLLRRAERRAEARHARPKKSPAALVPNIVEKQVINDIGTNPHPGESATGLAPTSTGLTPTSTGLAPTSEGLTPAFLPENTQNPPVCVVYSESERASRWPTNNKEQEDEVVVDQGSPKNETSHDPTTTGALLVMKVKQEEEKEPLLGGWCLGFTPKDALGRPWSEAEVKTYFQAPTPGRTFPGPILEVLDGFGLSLSQLRTLQSQTCFTNTGVRAVVDAVNRGVVRGRVLSGVGALYKILFSQPDPKTMCWVEDHWRIHRDAILAQAEAKKALSRRQDLPRWVSVLPEHWVTPETSQMVQDYLESTLADPGPRFRLGTSLLGQVVPDQVRAAWEQAFASYAAAEGLSSFATRRGASVFLAVEALVFLGAINTGDADQVSPSRRQVLGVIPVSPLVAQDGSGAGSCE